jgi:hypothetical protein
VRRPLAVRRNKPSSQALIGCARYFELIRYYTSPPRLRSLRTGIIAGATYISTKEEIAMFKVAVVAFALAISGFMLWVAHENSNFAQLPHATFVKRAA